MEWYLAAAIIFGALFLLLATGLPIVLCIGTVSFVSLVFLVGPSSISAMGKIAFSTSTSFVLVAVPLFLIMAEVIMFSGLGDQAYSVVNKWLGHLPGGLALSSIFACAIFAAINGSSVATAATVGKVAIPEMLKYGYDKKIATGCVAAAGALGILIPPSIFMVVYAVLTESSVGQLFMGGVFPGILLTTLYMVYVGSLCILKPNLGPRAARSSWNDRLLSLYKLSPVVVLMFLVLGTIYMGVATPTEAAAVGALGAIIIAIAYRKLTLAKLIQAGITSVQTTCFIFFLMVGASILVFVLSYLEVPQGLTTWALSLGLSRWGIMIAINVLYLILGCLLDPTSIIVMTLPVLFPIVTSLDFNPVWFGVIVTMNMEMANITPPVAFNLFVIKGVSPPSVTFNDVMLGALPFVMFQALGIAICMVFPQIVMWLPSTMVTK